MNIPADLTVSTMFCTFDSSKNIQLIYPWCSLCLLCVLCGKKILTTKSTKVITKEHKGRKDEIKK